MAISNLTYKDYLWLTKEKDGVKGIRLSKDNLPSTLNPIASKTFEHVWSTSKSTAEAKTFTGSGTTGGSNDSRDYYIYFGSIKQTGTSYTDSWHIKFRLVTECETNTSYRSEHICNLYGAGSTVSYAMFNNIYSGSYRNLYFMFLNRITSTGFNNGFSHLFGIDFYSTNTQNINNSNYKRKFYIEVLEQEGCEVSFFNDWISARNYTPATTSTNYYGYINTSNAVVGMGTEFNAVTNGLQETGDADNYYQIFSYFRPIAGGIGIKGISLISQLPDGTWASFTNSNAQVTTSNYTTTSNAPNTSDSFIIGAPIWYYSSNTVVNTDRVSTSDSVYSTTHAIDTRYISNYYHTTSGNANSFAYNGSGFKQSNAYIKINPNFDNGTYKIESLILNEKDQKTAGVGYYIYIGRTFSTSSYQINLEAQNPILYWTGSQFIEYSNYKDKISETNIANTYATKTALSSVQSTIDNATPLVAGTNVTIAKNGNNELVINAEGSVKKVNDIGPDNNGNISLSYNDLLDKPTLPLAASDTLGGIKIGYNSTSNNLAVQLDNEKAYISLPDHLKEFYTTVVNKPVSSGFYRFQDTNNSSAKLAFGNKATAYTWVSANNSGWAGQIGISFHSDDIAFRRKENYTDGWKSWIGIATKPWVDQNYSLKGHTHSASEVSGLITTRDIFCIDLVTDWVANMMPLDGGQINLGEDLLTMVYGDFITQDYNEEGFGILLSLNNGTTDSWFALVNNTTDQILAQSRWGIYEYDILQNLEELSNYHIEVFTYIDYQELYDGLWDIAIARNNLNYFCTVRLNEDKTAWIVEQ